MTPFFTGSEPVVATSGKYKGTSILQDEQNRGLALINALTDEQRKKAVLRFSKTGNDILTEAWRDNVVLDYAGHSRQRAHRGSAPAVARPGRALRR